MRVAAARHGTVNLTPSIAHRRDWGHAWTEFMHGWNAGKRMQENPHGTAPNIPTAGISAMVRRLPSGKVQIKIPLRKGNPVKRRKR